MDLYVREATGNYRVARPREVLDSARDCVGQVFGKGRHIEKPAVAAGLFAGKLAGLESERFAVLFLNQQHRVLAYEELFFGTIDASAVYPREVVKRALHHNAAAVILGHFVARNKMSVLCPIFLCASSRRPRRGSRTPDPHQAT